MHALAGCVDARVKSTCHSYMKRRRVMLGDEGFTHQSPESLRPSICVFNVLKKTPGLSTPAAEAGGRAFELPSPSWRHLLPPRGSKHS
jgi:hypothetical protein